WYVRRPRIPAAETFCALMVLEILHRPLVFLGGSARTKRAEIAPLAAPRILLPGIQPVLARFELADHGLLLPPFDKVASRVPRAYQAARKVRLELVVFEVRATLMLAVVPGFDGFQHAVALNTRG